MSTSIIGDNANLHAGVLTRAELDGLMETAWSEMVVCPECRGARFVTKVHIADVGDVAHLCEWCEGTGEVTRAVAGEWEEAYS